MWGSLRLAPIRPTHNTLSHNSHCQTTHTLSHNTLSHNSHCHTTHCHTTHTVTQLTLSHNSHCHTTHTLSHNSHTVTQHTVIQLTLSHNSHSHSTFWPFHVRPPAVRSAALSLSLYPHEKQDWPGGYEPADCARRSREDRRCETLGHTRLGLEEGLRILLCARLSNWSGEELI